MKIKNKIMLLLCVAILFTSFGSTATLASYKTEEDATASFTVAGFAPTAAALQSSDIKSETAASGSEAGVYLADGAYTIVYNEATSYAIPFSVTAAESEVALSYVLQITLPDDIADDNTYTYTVQKITDATMNGDLLKYSTLGDSISSTSADTKLYFWQTSSDNYFSISDIEDAAVHYYVLNVALSGENSEEISGIVVKAIFTQMLNESAE